MSRAGIASRLRPLLARMRAGDDVPPAPWFRAEGFLEALLASGALDAAGLAAAIEEQYLAELGQGTAALFGEPASTWIDADGSVRLRFRLPRAPVFPAGGGSAR